MSLSDARRAGYRAGMLRAAEIAERFSIDKTPIHPDFGWDEMSKQAQTITHTTCQCVAAAIRAEAEDRSRQEKTTTKDKAE